MEKVRVFSNARRRLFVDEKTISPAGYRRSGLGLNETGKRKCELGLGQQNLFPAARTLIACDVIVGAKLSRFVVEARLGEPLVWNRGPHTSLRDAATEGVEDCIIGATALAR